jgi:PAS domain S-box-containing protein
MKKLRKSGIEGIDDIHRRAEESERRLRELALKNTDLSDEVNREMSRRKMTEEALWKTHDRLSILSETAGRLLTADRPQEIVDELCGKVMTYMNCHVFFNYLVDEGKGRLHLNAFAGIPEEVAGRMEWLDYGVEVCGCAARDGSSIVCENISETPDPRTERVKSLGIEAYACYPLFSEGRVIGTLSFGTRSRLTFTIEDLYLMKTVADQVAVAMERIQLIEALQKSRNELEVRVQERTVELAKKNELLEHVFSSIDLKVAHMDRDFNFIRVNRAYAEMDQREPEFFVGKNHFALYPNQENEALFKRVIETGEPYFVYGKPFVYGEHPERGVTYWDWSLQPIKEADGNVSEVILSLVNVTEHKRAQEELWQTEEKLRKILETLPVGVWVADEAGRLVMSNPAGQRIWGGTAYVDIDRYGEYKGWWLDTGKRIEKEEWAAARAIRKGETSLQEEVEIECFDGTHKIILNSALPIQNEKKEIKGAIIINQDISERKRAERAFRQIQKMEALGTLAGGIAHDFNNILMPIVINTELAILDTPEDSPILNYLKLVQEAANRGKELVQQIITFSRQKEQLKVPIEIAPVVKEALKFLRSSIPKNIEIREQIEVPNSLVVADPTQIHQVLMNLCSNAAYAMREKGGIMEIGLIPVDVDPDRNHPPMDIPPGPYLRLTVSDTGRGMDKEIMEKIFDPFFTTKKPGEGTGMGLAVVHGIVKNHKGAITVYSEAGKGSTFNIFLPMARGEFEAETASSKPIPKGRERILLIDDEEIQIRSVQPMLERLGYVVTGKTNALESLEVFRAKPDAFDLVITDQTMPHLTGQELTEEFLRIRPDIPIVLCTGFSEVIHEEGAKAVGVREFIMKPFSAGEMAERIRKALRKNI